MTRLPIWAEHLRYKHGALISILPPVRKLDTSQEGEVEIADPPVRLQAVPEDPAVQVSGLAAYWRHHNRREGDDAKYSQVLVAIVRAFVQIHGGVAEAEEEALAELKRAGALELPDPATDSPAPAVVDDLRLDEFTPAVIEARQVFGVVNGTVMPRLEAFCRLKESLS